MRRSSPKVFGTDRFSSVNSATAEHLIEDHQLQEAIDVGPAEVGALTCVYDDEFAGTTESDGPVQGIYTKTNGDIYYKDNEKIYSCPGDGGVASEVYDTGETSDIFAVQAGGSVYLFDGTATVVHDGDSFRDHGPITPATDGSEYGWNYLRHEAASTKSISGATAADPCVITATSHGLSNGDLVYIDGIVGMTELNGGLYEADNVATNTFELKDIDSSDFTAYSSGGTVYIDASALGAGTYQYRLSYTIELPSGTVLETDPELLKVYPDFADSFTGSPTERVRLTISKISQADIQAYVSPNSGAGHTIGTDILAGAKLWRTKSDGAEFYLEHTFDHSDIYGVAGGLLIHDSQVIDSGLGAALVRDYEANGQPPQATAAALVGGKLYINDPDNPTYVRFSGFYGPDYFHPLDYIDVGGVVTAIAPFDRDAIIFSASRMWRYNNDDGLGRLDTIAAPTGCASQTAVAETEYGLVFAADSGLYLFNGGQVKKISDAVENLWQACDGPWQVAASDGDVRCWPDDTNDADFNHFSCKLSNRGIEWYQREGWTSGTKMWPDVANDKIYIAGTAAGSPNYTDVLEIEGASSRANGDVSIISKAFGNGRTMQLAYLVLDISTDNIAGNSPQVVVSSNSGATFTETGIDTDGARTTLRYPLPQDMIGERFTVTVTASSGKMLGLYGLWLEAAQ